MRTQGLLNTMALLVLLLLGLSASAQTKHWIGGSGNWADAAHWSFAPNGPGGAGVPRANEDVVIDPRINSTITLPAQAWCRDLRINAANSTVHVRGTVNSELHMGGAWSMAGAVQWDYRGDVRLIVRSGGVELDLRGVPLKGRLVLDGAGTWSMISDLVMAQGLPVVMMQGDLITNGNLLKAEALHFEGRKAKRLFAGNSAIVLNEAPEIQALQKVLVPGSSTLVVNGAARSWGLPLLDAQEAERAINVCGIDPGQTSFQVNAQVTTSYNGFGVKCRGECNATVTVSVVGGVGPFTYLWLNGGPLTATWTAACGGSQIVLVTDVGQGVTCPVQVTVSEPDPLGVFFFGAGTRPTCAGVCDGSRAALAVGGVMPLSYNWNNGSGTSSSFSGLCAGLNTLSIVDANGCAFDTTFFFDVQPIIPDLSFTDPTCFNDCDGSAQVNPTGGTGGLIITWSPAPPVGQGTGNASGLCAGSYAVNIADANGCDTTLTFVITAPPPILITENSVDATCSASCDGTSTVTPSGVVGPFTFLWTPAPGTGQGTGVVGGLCQGTYTVLVTDQASGCDTLVTVLIDAPDALELPSTVEDASCSDTCDGSVDVTVSGGTAPYQYEWSPAPPVGQGTASVSGLCAGVWQLLLTDAVGCDTTVFYTVAAPPALDPQLSTADVSCAGLCDGEASVTVGGGTPGYTYLWTPAPLTGQGTASASGLCAGTYSILITDFNGCDTTLAFVIVEPPPLEAVPTQSDVTCGGLCDGTASAAVNGGTAGYTYLWSPAPSGGQGTADATGLCAGTYTLLITDSNGCELSIPFVIEDAVPIMLSLQVLPASCPGVCDGSAGVIASGGEAPYSYLWVPAPAAGQGTANVTGLCPQAYTLTVTDALGCDTTIAFTVDQPLPIEAVPTLTDASCANECDGSIALVATGGTGTYTYLWSPVPGAGQGTATASQLCAGNWSVRITSGVCDTTLTFEIFEPAPITVGVVSSVATCPGECDGAASVAVSGGTPSYTYLWTPAPGAGQGSPNATGLCAGSYSLLIGDANGCDTTIVVLIVEPLPLVADAVQTDLTCGSTCDGTASVSVSGGTPGYTYLWAPAPGGGQGTADATGLCAGTYMLLITDSNGCELSVPFVIADAVPIELSVQVLPVSCPGVCDGSAGVIASGGEAPYSYLWSPAPGAGQGTASVTGLCPQAYTLTVTDAVGCDTTIAFTVDQPLPIEAVPTVTDANCANECDGSITLVATGGTGTYTYLWSPVPGAGQGTATASQLCAGSWSVLITSGVCDTTLTFEIIEPLPITAGVISTVATCPGECDGTANVSVTGGTAGYSYAWTPAPGAGQGTPNVTGLCAGSYSLLITDLNGCDTTITVVIDEPLPLEADPSQTNLTCGSTCDGTASVNVSGGTAGYNYLWTPAPGGGQGTADATGLCAGTYTLLITDSNGCELSVPFLIEDAVPIDLSLQVLPASCPNTCDGSAGVIASGGVAPYSYLWSPDPAVGQGTANATGLCAQAYTLTVTDGEGCDTTIAFTVTAPPLIDVVATMVDLQCAGECEGSIDLAVSGGSGAFTYLWTPAPAAGQGTAMASQLCAGNWSVLITSGVCDTTLTFEILEPLPLAVELVTADLSCSGDCDGAATAIVSGGTANYTYLWTPAPAMGQGTASAGGLCAGNYSLLVLDANGCDTTLVFEILENQPIEVDLALTPSGCDSLCAGTATAAVSGGVGPYQYNWGPGVIAGQGTAVASGLCSGFYTLEIVDALGCDTTIQFLIAAPSGILAAPAVTDVTCNALCDGSVVVPTSGGFAPYTYLWMPAPAVGQGTNSVSGLCAGAYTLLISDALACDTTMIILIAEPLPLTPNGSSTNVSCNGPCDGTASVVPSGGTAPYTFNWVPAPPTGQGTSDVSGLCPGDWSVTISDGSGCDTTLTFTILDQQPIDAGLDVSDVLCAGQCTGSATATPSNGIAPYTFLWSPEPGSGQGTGTAGGLCAGSYTVLITDALGCDTLAAFTIDEPDAITIDLLIEAEDCTAPCTGSATATVAGGTAPYTYLWQPEPGAGQGSPNATGLCAGTTYQLTIIDAAGCDTTITLEVDPFDEILANSSSTPASCSDACNGTATVGPTGGTAPYTYVWSPEPATGQGTPQATGLCAGLVEVTITDADGCSILASILILAPDPIASLASQQDVSCAGSCDGSIILSTTGGSAPYLYSWSPVPPNGQGAPEALSLCAGAYSVTITDSNGCELQENFTILEPAPLVISTVNTPSQCLLCNGASNVIISGGTIPFTVEWTDISGTSIGTSDNIQNVCAGIYSVRVTDGNGCTQSATVTIVDADGEVITTTGGTTSCPGECDGTVSVDFTCSEPPCAIDWTDGTGASLGQNGNTATGLCAGTYLAVVTNASGCISIEAATVVDPQGLVAAISSSPVSCAGNCDGTATVGVSGVSGPFTFTWSPEPDAGQGTPSASGLCEGVYAIDITDGNGCLTQLTVLIIAPPALELNGTSEDISCAGQCDGSITLLSSGGTAPYTYSWSPAPPAGQSGPELTGLCAGTWTAAVTDSNGCSITKDFTIVEPSELTLDISSTPSTCPVCDGTASVSPSGGSAPYQITWTTGGVAVGTDATITGLCGGLYIASVIDASGCAQQATVQVADPSGETLTMNDGQVTCANDCDASVSVDFVCSVAPCVLQWTDDSGNVIAGDVTEATQLCVGEYTVQITNGDGCVSFGTATVSPAQIIVPNLSSSPVSCAGICDGTATVGPLGGVTPYTFLWSNGSDTPQATGLCAGVHSVTIGDASGCDTTITVLILEPLPLAVNGSVQSVLCADDCNGSISASVSGGTAPYQYEWTPAPGAGQGTATALGLCAGEYVLLITDASGCTLQESFTVTSPDPLAMSTTSAPSECGLCNGTLEVLATGGTAPYINLWTLNGAIFGTADSLSDLCAGLYIVEVTDASGCQATLAVPLSDSNGEVTSTTDGLTSCPGNCDGEVAVNFVCTDPVCSIAWFDGVGNDLGQTGNQVTALCAGTYFVQVTNGTGCITIDTAFVASPDPILPNLGTTPVSCFGDCDGTATVGPTGGSGTYVDYFWEPGVINGQGSPQATDLCAGTYTVTITDSDGCSITSGVLLLGPDALEATASNTPVQCATECNGAITVTPQGGTLPYAYAWSPEPANGQGTNEVDGLCAGTWSVIITDGNGCVVEYSYDITEPAPLQVDLSATDNICFTDCGGTATVVASGGTAPYTTLWTNANGDTIAQDVDFVDALCTGTYSVAVSDANGCVIEGSVTIGSPDPIDSDLSFTNETCFGPCDGTAAVLPSGGVGPYTILWQPEPDQGQGTDEVSGLCPGPWTVTISDALGCDTTFAFTILPFEPIEANGTVSDVLCGIECTGSITTAVTGGLGGYVYTWTPEPPSGQAPTAEELCAGNYSLTISDLVGCDSTFTFTVSEPPALTISVDAVVAASCADAFDGSISTTISGGTAPVDIAWTGPSGFTSTQDDLSGLAPGTYTQTLTDGNGCTLVSEVVVDALSTLVADAGLDQQVCNGVTTQLDGSASTGAVTYSWTDQNGVVLGNSANVDLGVLPPGNYTFTLLIADGPCTASDQVSVEVLALPIADAGPEQTIFLGETITLGGSPTGPSGSTFSWVPDSLLSSSSAANPTTVPPTTAWYTVTVVGPDGCVAVDSVLITVVPDVVIHTGFTPNGDGYNDTWIIDFIELFPNAEVEIYNRWGEMLFRSVGYRTPWDGRYSGGPVPVGTYYYVVKLNDPEFPDAYTGPLTVIR